MKVDSTVLRALYGTDDTEAILHAKETDKQVRAFAGGNGGKVELSVDEIKSLLKKANNAKYYAGDEHRVREYVVTNETVDRYGDIVRAKGVSLANYAKNPVVQFAHDYEQPPVGLSIKTWYDKDNKCIRSWVVFNCNEADPSGRSDLIFRLVESNRMRACSIGFMPIETRRPKNDEERAELGLGQFGIEFIKSDMMEFSPCPVPANPDALNSNFVKSYNEEFIKTLRSGLFTKKDVDVLRAYPLFGEDAIDAFIKELDARSAVTVPADVPPSAKAEDAAPAIVNVDLSPVMALTEKIATLTNEIAQLRTEVQSQLKLITDATADTLSANSDVDDEPVGRSLYEEVLRDDV